MPKKLFLATVGLFLVGGRFFVMGETTNTFAIAGKPLTVQSRASQARHEIFATPTAAPAPLFTSKHVKPTVISQTDDFDGTYFGRKPEAGKTKHYYIAAELVNWDYMPTVSDVFCGIQAPGMAVQNHTALKVRYFQYTDASFTKRVPQSKRLGILGPVLRGVVGQYLAVTFLNRAPGGVFSMHPHGVKYDKDSEGSYETDAMPAAQGFERGAKETVVQGRGAAVGYGGEFTYVWYCDASSGPQPNEPSSKAWLYHSHVSGESDINLGLEGFITVTDPKRARPDGTPMDVDREMAALFLIFNDGGPRGDSDDRPQVRLTIPRADGVVQRYSINGCAFGNLQGLDMNEGEHVRWYLFGLGSESDIHTPHWHGLRVHAGEGNYNDVVELLPGSMKTIDMDADNAGTWLFHCHVEEHMCGGMFAHVTVYPKDHPVASRSPQDAFFGLQTNAK